MALLCPRQRLVRRPGIPSGPWLRPGLPSRSRSLLRGSLLALLVCLAGGAARAGSLTGMANLQEPVPLPVDAVFEVELQDISLADAPAVVLSRATLQPPGPLPIRFRLPYDPSALRPGHRYSVRATIRRHGQLLFTTDTVVPVLDGPVRPLALRLITVAPPRPQPLTGLFSVMADAPGFRPCPQGPLLPVAMEGAYPALERAALRSRLQPGASVLVRVEALILPRPSAEPGQPLRPTLVVERLLAVSARSSCPVGGAVATP